MSENSLFQFAQVIADQPTHPPAASAPPPHTAAHHRITLSQPPFPPARSADPMPRRFLPIRKNACIVCGVCFTCSRVYGTNCICEEVQPRRGKNLPEGSLDSRAKKLHPQDKEDYEFSMQWLAEHAHAIYKDEAGTVVGLRDLSEVSLCKAHSSTLYRAKKRHERGRNQAPPSPADSNGLDMMDRDPYPLHPHPHQQQQQQQQQQHYPPFESGPGGGLAAKVRELHYTHYRHTPPPDFMMQPSSSLKRKRTSRPPASPVDKPHSSASTPLYATGMAPLLSHHPSSSSSAAESAARHDTDSTFSLPPLHSRASSLSALSSSFQNHLHLSSPYHRQPSSSTPPTQSASSPHTPAAAAANSVLETVSLKSLEAPAKYYFRNLAITDSFTFRDLLKEIDMTGSPPQGKRIVVSDDKNETFFPLDQPIRSVIRRPHAAHIELCLGLSDKPSIDWSTYA